MVRLKVAIEGESDDFLSFQFQYGAIESYTVIPETVGQFTFQFQYGAIEST